MKSKLLVMFYFVVMSCLLQRSEGGCWKETNAACGWDCTGTPACNGKKCGNVDDMCYCECDNSNGWTTKYKCRTTELGYKWNGGIKKANGDYALNGTKGDDKEYKC